MDRLLKPAQHVPEFRCPWVSLSSARGATSRVEDFGSPVVATAILDRLLQHSHVITIRGASYRLTRRTPDGVQQRDPSTSLSQQGVNS